ncbi:4Fe-4S dicluster domain-containing protein [Planctomycetota bacterium]
MAIPTLGKKLRLNRIFNPQDQRALCVAADHGWMTDPTDNVINLENILKQVIAGGADALLVSFGMAMRYSHLLKGRQAPALLLRADWMNLPRLGTGGASDSNIVPVQNFKRVAAAKAEDALSLGASGITIYYFIGYSDEFEARNLENCAWFARSCERVGLPLIIEPIATGGMVTGTNMTDLLIASARIAAEIGADALKIPYTGDVDSFSRLVKAAEVPVLMLGGARSKTPRDALELVEEGLQAGASGIVFGRNITRAKEPEKMVRHIVQLIHSHKTVDEILKSTDPLRLKTNQSLCTGCKICEVQCAFFHNQAYGQLATARLKIQPNRQGYKISFCTLCKKCIEVCEPAALQINAAIGHIELDPVKCNGCKKCADVCPMQVVQFEDQTAQPLFCDLCNGLPQCAKWCPEEAIKTA